MQNKFCKALSNALSLRIPGDTNSLTFNPCCLYDEYLPFHPTLYKKHREKFIAADQDFLPGCSKCKLKESTHGTSHRLINNRDIPNGIGDEIYKLEIVLDTTCNAACIQCGTYQSSLWRNEMAARDPNYINIQPESQIDKKIKIINESMDLSKVKEFHFWGGEPLITDTHLKFLNKIEDPSDVVVRYTTNGSIFPSNDILELWSKFKEVKIGISTDGIDEQFYYIRWPLKWDKVSRNIIRFRDETPSNTDFHVNACALPLNVYYMQDLIEWLDVNFSKHRNGDPINCNFIRGEGTIDVACTPQKLRDVVIKNLGENHVISDMLIELPVLEPDHMIRHLNKWDPIRKLDWRQTFPDIVKYFE